MYLNSNRRLKHPSLTALLISSGLLLSASLQADPYVTGSVGMHYSNADQDQQEAILSGDVINDTSSTAFKLGLGYNFHSMFAGELGYLNLGEVNSKAEFTDGYTQAAFSQTAESDGPESGKGFYLAGVFRAGITNDLKGLVKLGMFRWKENVDYENTNYEGSGTKPFFGAGLSYQLSHNWSVQAEAERYKLDDESSNLFSMGIAYTFGSPEPVKIAEPIVPPTPKAPEPVDTDKDGVFDPNDKCPSTPMEAKVDASGCPLDSDKDTVIDINDKCPNTPLGAAVDYQGCPIDSDKDGVADYEDKCAATPSQQEVNEQGCQLLPTEGIRLVILFNKESSNLAQDYASEIKEVAEFIQKYDTAKATIEGHTDSRGAKDFNLQLSEARANGVLSELVNTYQLSPTRFKVKAYGEDKPVASNKTAEGRAQNRRVEILVEPK